MKITTKGLPEGWRDELNATYRQRPAAADALRRVVDVLTRSQAEADTKLGLKAHSEARRVASMIENHSAGGTVQVRDYTVIATVSRHA